MYLEKDSLVKLGNHITLVKEAKYPYASTYSGNAEIKSLKPILMNEKWLELFGFTELVAHYYIGNQEFFIAVAKSDYSVEVLEYKGAKMTSFKNFTQVHDFQRLLNNFGFNQLPNKKNSTKEEISAKISAVETNEEFVYTYKQHKLTISSKANEEIIYKYIDDMIQYIILNEIQDYVEEKNNQF
jgi:hypothetical protein